MAKPAQKLSDLPELAGWVTFGEAAKMMGVTVERVRQLASQPNPKLTTAHRIGLRPNGIVRTSEVEKWVAEKEEAKRRAAEKEEARARESTEQRAAETGQE